MTYGLLCFVLLLMAMIHGHNLVYAVCFYTTVMGLSLAKMINDSVEAVTIESIAIKPSFANEETIALVKIHNKSSKFLQEIVLTLGHSKEPQLSLNLKPKEVRTVDLIWKPTQRGLQLLPRLRISSRSPSGLFAAWKLCQEEKKFVVYPERQGKKEYPKSSLEAPDVIGVLREIRDYKPGDSPKRIHWRSLAKNQKVRTLVHEGNEGQTCHLNWDQVSHLNSEAKLQQLTLWIDIAESQQILWDLTMPRIQFSSSEPQGAEKALSFLALFQGDDP